MELGEQIDIYCERLDPSFWAEPVNALTNAAFLIAALVCLRLPAVRADWGTLLLTGILTAIGIGSFLFHTFATRWALLSDVIPIQLFIFAYVFLATRRFFSAPIWASVIAMILVVPYSAGLGAVLLPITGPLNGSLGYVPTMILIALYGAALLRRSPATAYGLLMGAGLLALSLFFRTADAPVCGSFPLGTHFLWHMINGLLLGWMIYVMAAHPRAKGA
ncbi:MAG: hypothetical protein AAGI50_16515 [Pseudomonadota bacterium]